MLRATAPFRTLDGLVAFDPVPTADIYYVTAPCQAERARHIPRHRRFGLPHRHSRALEAEMMAEPAPDLIVPAAGLARHFQTHYGLPSTKLHTVAPTLPPDNDRAGDTHSVRTLTRDSVGTPPLAPVILVVGSFPLRDRLLRELKSLFAKSENPPEVWHIHGPGTTRPHIRSVGRVVLRTWPPRADVTRFFAACDLLLHTGWRDPMAKTPLRAARYGLSVVATQAYMHTPYLHTFPRATVLPADTKPRSLIGHLKERLEAPSARPPESNPAAIRRHYPRLQTSHTPNAQLIAALLRDRSAS